MQLFNETLARIIPVDLGFAEATQRILDDKTKPRRSLGRLEDIACQLAAIHRTTQPPLPTKAIIVMGADHGVVAEGVSAYPQEVTAQMLLNFARGGAAINVLARHVGARVVVVDLGVAALLPAHAEIRSERIGAGTRNMARGPAMSRDEAVRAIEVGIKIAHELVASGVTLLGIGEMGIGNTTAASALTAAFTGAPAAEVTGRGTGIDDPTLRHKIDVVRQALAINHVEPAHALDTLAKLGGFEIAGLCGVVLGASAARVPVVMDGFIASTAALCAVRMASDAAGYLLASHRSLEAGHRLVLDAIGARPLLDLDMRLGEGTGAALGMSLVEAALLILHEMATFEAAGVSTTGA